MTDLKLHLENTSFRFDPRVCRSANITLMEAKLLRWLFITQTNLWKLPRNGLGIWKIITGVKA